MRRARGSSGSLVSAAEAMRGLTYVCPDPSEQPHPVFLVEAWRGNYFRHGPGVDCHLKTEAEVGDGTASATGAPEIRAADLMAYWIRGIAISGPATESAVRPAKRWSGHATGVRRLRHVGYGSRRTAVYVAPGMVIDRVPQHDPLSVGEWRGATAEHHAHGNDVLWLWDIRLLGTARPFARSGAHEVGSDAMLECARQNGNRLYVVDQRGTFYSVRTHPVAKPMTARQVAVLGFTPVRVPGRYSAVPADDVRMEPRDALVWSRSAVSKVAEVSAPRRGVTL